MEPLTSLRNAQVQRMEQESVLKKRFHSPSMDEPHSSNSKPQLQLVNPRMLNKVQGKGAGRVGQSVGQSVGHGRVS
jgi:hypothetical protein